MSDHFMKSARLIGLLVAVACSDQPVPTDPGGTAVSVAVSDLTVESAAINDAITRIIPSLSDEVSAAQLANAFADLSAALSGIDPRSIDGQVTRARAALDGYQDAGGEAADLDALTMALSAVTKNIESVLRENR